MTQPHEPAAVPDEVPASTERPATTGPYDDETLSRLLHDLDVANDWHP
ncbi:hypothetical protein ACQP04_34320 [Pseudonocardia halophobica]